MPRNQCPVCNLVLVRSTDLGRHMKVHLSAEARDEVTYKCRYCDYSALQRSNLVTHEHTHTGGKPHKCPDCSLAYTDPGSLTRHRKKLHGYLPAPRVKKALSSEASRRVAPYKQLGETVPSPHRAQSFHPLLVAMNNRTHLLFGIRASPSRYLRRNRPCSLSCARRSHPPTWVVVLPPWTQWHKRKTAFHLPYHRALKTRRIYTTFSLATGCYPPCSWRLLMCQRRQCPRLIPAKVTTEWNGTHYLM
ncbi:hypothetical protein BD779DRAFT_795398 [Infundibulicybe gibba]|nr:hypothetical protein BD779DRAFT_795398 [Infundibulicybe gibba]